MRKLAYFGAVFLIACATRPTPPSNGFEDLVTCRTTDSAKTAVESLVNSRGFKTDPANANFYVPTETATAFGFEVRYVGLRGVMMQPGPNLSVVAPLDQLKRNVEATLGETLECGKIGCWRRLSKSQAIIIYPYETDKALSTVQCGHYGP